jgi:hypothetical protein
LIPKVKRAFGSCLAGVLEFITLGALLLAYSASPWSLPTHVAALRGL